MTSISVKKVSLLMNDLSFSIGITVQTIFVSQKLEQVVKSNEAQSPVIYQQCVIKSFSRNLCNADYVGYTAQHLHQCIFKNNNSAIGVQLLEAHGSLCYLNENEFCIPCKWRAKFNYLVYEVLFT